MKKTNKKNFFKQNRKIRRNKKVKKVKQELVVTEKQQKIVGTFVKNNNNFGFVIPDSQKIPTDIFIAKKNMGNAKNNEKVLVEITKQPAKGKKLEGKVIEIIGRIDEAGVDMLCLMKEYGLPNEFSKTVLNELEYIDEKIDKKDIPNRVDLREQEIFTIDGEDAKDLDDAVSVEKLENGTYNLHVHIADVSYYVKEGSSLNKEAIQRGTSVYMLDRVIPMLPPKLSNGICSLNEGEDRFTLSISMNIDKRGKVLSSKIYKAVINVTKRMTYIDVYKILEGKDKKVLKKYEPYINHFKTMQELAIILEKRRLAKGYLDLDIPESKIILDENGIAIDVQKYEITIANKIIEQFMLTANEEIAETFCNLNAPFIYRTHEEPAIEKVQELNQFLFNLGYQIEIKNKKVEPKSVQKVLKQIKGRPEEKVISTLILRTLKMAKYENVNKGHFGIASKYYCHFTSPIRRYPDLFIHRVISTYIRNNYQLEDKVLSKLKSYSEKYAILSSEREQIATKIERDAEDLKKAEYMQDKIGKEYEGVISAVTEFGVFVELENTVEGLVRFENLGNDYYIYHEERKTLVGEHSKETFTIGDKIKIKVLEANKLTRKIAFERVTNFSIN